LPGLGEFGIRGRRCRRTCIARRRDGLRGRTRRATARQDSHDYWQRRHPLPLEVRVTDAVVYFAHASIQQTQRYLIL
jgi:hypothetical protein